MIHGYKKYKIALLGILSLLLYPYLLLAENIPLTKKGGVYEVPVEVNGVITLKFILDTGASEVHIPADVALTLYRTGTIREIDFLPGKIYRLADGSILKSSRFLLQSLKIGNKRITNVPTSIGNISSPLLLGQSFLERLGAWGIDSQKQTLMLGAMPTRDKASIGKERQEVSSERMPQPIEQEKRHRQATTSNPSLPASLQTTVAPLGELQSELSGTSLRTY
jgi:clan AA aspartic protease (TIGR02281 family)